MSNVKVFATQDGRPDKTTVYIDPHVTHIDQKLSNLLKLSTIFARLEGTQGQHWKHFAEGKRGGGGGRERQADRYRHRQTERGGEGAPRAIR